MLIGTCLAAAGGSRSTSSATPRETATSTVTVTLFSSERVADGQREKDSEHNGRAPLDRRANGCSNRDLDHDDGRERSEHRVPDPRHHLRDPPRQTRGQRRLDDDSDLGRRRWCPRTRRATRSRTLRGDGASTEEGYTDGFSGPAPLARSTRAVAMDPDSSRGGADELPTRCRLVVGWEERLQAQLLSGDVDRAFRSSR